MKILHPLAIFFAATLALPAAPSAQSLGQNLTYRRVRELPADLPKTAAAPPGALVLDLRFAPATENDATAFAAWLRFYARPQAPVFVLVNDRTDRALLASLIPAAKPAGVITLGPAREGMNWDIPIKVSAEADRDAYERLEQGTPIDRLIVRKVEKIRRDEASMAKSWNGSQVENDLPEETDPTTEVEGKPAVVEPPLDLVLQRAVQLHRSLLALKKIPAG